MCCLIGFDEVVVHTYHIKRPEVFGLQEEFDTVSDRQHYFGTRIGKNGRELTEQTKSGAQTAGYSRRL